MTVPLSFQHYKRLDKELVQQRMRTVHRLSESQTELYEIMMDTITEEHYLHYVYIQLHLSNQSEQESYHHLLPLQTDDVLAVMLGGQPYSYPDDWTRRYLRYGVNQDYVWFDPGYMETAEDSERHVEQITELLKAFKQRGAYSPQEIAKLFAQLDHHNDSGKDKP